MKCLSSIYIQNIYNIITLFEITHEEKDNLSMQTILIENSITFYMLPGHLFVYKVW